MSAEQVRSLCYVAQAHAQFPSSYANNFQVMKMCAAFAALGVQTTLVTSPRHRRDRGDVDLDSYLGFYGVPPVFAIEPLRFGYPFRRLRRSAHALAVVRYLRCRPGCMVYTRSEWVATAAAIAGVPTVLELHHLSRGPARWQAFRRAGRAGPLLAVVVVSDSLRRAVVARGVPAQKVLVAPDGVDLRLFEPPLDAAAARSRLGWPPDVPTVVHLGSLYAGRGIETVMGAAARLPAVRFVLVGGPAPDAERWRVHARNAGLANVFFPGVVTNPDVPLRLFAADVLVMPYADGTATREYMSPMKMFEYMAAGRQIVASDYPVLREVLTDDMALFVPPGEADALGGALRDALADPAAGARRGAAARKAALGYDWSARARRILDFLTIQGIALGAERTTSP